MATNVLERVDDTNYGVSAQVDWTTGALTLTSITGYRMAVLKEELKLSKDIIEKNIIPGTDVLKKRQHIRINISFPMEFEFHRNHRTILGKANILNLSECGVLAAHVVALDTNTEKIDNCRAMAEQDIYNLKFKPTGDLTSITTQGKCVREFMNGESLYAGIRFKDINHRQREIIRSFVDAHK